MVKKDLVNKKIIDIVTIIFGSLLVIAVIIAIVFLIINLTKKNKRKDLLIYDQFDNKIGYFPSTHCKKVKFEKGDRVIIKNNEHIPIYFYLSSYMLPELNKYCKFKFYSFKDTFSSQENFASKKQDKLVIMEALDKNNILRAFESSNLILNPVHPFIYAYTPEKLFNRFIKLSLPKRPNKLIKSGKTKILYVNFIKLLELDDGKDYSKFENIVPKKYTDDFKPIVLQRLKKKYYDWYNFLEKHFSDVFCTLRYNRRNAINKMLEFENMDQLNKKIASLSTSKIEKETSNIEFNRYSIHFDEMSNAKKNLYNLYDKCQERLIIFLEDLKQQENIESSFIDHFQVISKYVTTVKKLGKADQIDDDIDNVATLNKTLIKPDELDIFINNIDVPTNSSTINKKYYRLIPKNAGGFVTNEMILQIYGNNINFNNYFVNNLKFMSNFTFSNNNLSKIILGSEEEPVNLKKLMCFNIESFTRPNKTFIEFDINVGEAYDNLKLYNILESKEYLQKLSGSINLEEANLKKSKIVFHKADYKFMRNIQRDVKEGINSNANKFGFKVFKKINDHMGAQNVFKLSQCDKTEVSTIFEELDELNEVVIAQSPTTTKSEGTTGTETGSGTGTETKESFKIAGHIDRNYNGCYEALPKDQNVNGNPKYKHTVNDKYLYVYLSESLYYWILSPNDTFYYGEGTAYKINSSTLLEDMTKESLLDVNVDWSIPNIVITEGC